MKKNPEVWFGAIGIAIIGLIVFAAIGPAGCSRSVSAWHASAYGSDWLVVQYAQDGSIMNHWELRSKSVANETNSDGINFMDNDGNMVHLSGHYTYIQIDGESGMKAAKSRYLGAREHH